MANLFPFSMFYWRHYGFIVGDVSEIAIIDIRSEYATYDLYLPVDEYQQSLCNGIRY